MICKLRCELRQKFNTLPVICLLLEGFRYEGYAQVGIKQVRRRIVAGIESRHILQIFAKFHAQYTDHIS